MTGTGRKVITICCNTFYADHGVFSISCFGDRDVKRIFATLARSKDLTMGQLVQDALLKKYATQINSLKARGVNNDKALIDTLAQGTGKQIGYLVRDALDECYEMELKALKDGLSM